MQKTCTQCLTDKDLNEFGAEPRGYLGRKSVCKDCQQANRAAKKLVDQALGVSKPKRVVTPQPKPEPEVVIVEKYIEVPHDEAAIQAEVDARVKKERQALIARSKQRTVEQRAQLKAMHMLIQNHPEEYARLVERETIRIPIMDQWAS